MEMLLQKLHQKFSKNINFLLKQILKMTVQNNKIMQTFCNIKLKIGDFFLIGSAIEIYIFLKNKKNFDTFAKYYEKPQIAI